MNYPLLYRLTAEYIKGVHSMNTNETLTALSAQLEELKAILSATNSSERQNASGNRLSFTEKEIMKMPKSTRKHFRIHGHDVNYRKRNTGRYNQSYEIRYAKKPYDKHHISASGRTLEEAKERFIEKLIEAEASLSCSYYVLSHKKLRVQLF